MSIKPKRPQLSKIKSWTAGLGAKLSGGSSSLDPSFKQDLAAEIEQRNKGNSNLYAATEAYWSYLGKKKPAPFDTSSLPVDDSSSSINYTSSKPERKMLPIESLGLAMTSFGLAFPEGSSYGSCLGLLGEAHIKLGSLQAAFAKDTSHIFLARIARSKAALEAFNAAMKKLDSATTRLDAAQTKVQKSKKEKRDLEEELRLAKAAYDEAVTDVEARAEAIQESEQDDWECLTTYMEAQKDYFSQCEAVLNQVKSMWSESAPTGGYRSGTSTPNLNRPRSLSGAKPRPPPLPRRASAKDATELASGLGSRFTSRSSLSLGNSDTRDREADDVSIGGASRKDKEKKNRLRMPSFSGAGDTVTSLASGLGSIGRSKSSGFFGTNGETNSPEKEREGSKWSFMSRNKKEPGFMSMEESERLHYTDDRDATIDGRERAYPRHEETHRTVSSSDVNLGPHDSFQVRSNSLSADTGRETDEEPSPFSPPSHNPGFLSANTGAHETIHEKGESQFSGDIALNDNSYLGISAAPSDQMTLALNHTGLSAYSDNVDPFSGSALSPQTTGNFYHPEASSSDDEAEYEKQALTAGALVDSTGERINRSRSGSNANGNGSTGLGWKFSRPGSSSDASSPASASVRGPPPPVPSSASFLSKTKSRLAPPPPPPLPSRNSS